MLLTAYHYLLRTQIASPVCNFKYYWTTHHYLLSLVHVPSEYGDCFFLRKFVLYQVLNRKKHQFEARILCSIYMRDFFTVDVNHVFITLPFILTLFNHEFSDHNNNFMVDRLNNVGFFGPGGHFLGASRRSTPQLGDHHADRL